MDALVKSALDKVIQNLDYIPWNSVHTQDQEDAIAKAIHAVDALKSALKAFNPDDNPEIKRPPEIETADTDNVLSNLNVKARA